MELVQIEAKDYGLEETKAQEISSMFKPMLDAMVGLEKEFNELNKIELSEDKCKQAKELRLRYVKTRTGTAKIHRELKSYYLNGGRFVDGWKNAQLMASQGIEEKLSEIENHYANIELEKIAQLKIDREKEITPYLEDVSLMPPNLGGLVDDVWEGYIKSTKAAYEARIIQEKLTAKLEKEEAERIEAERIAKEKAEQEERKRIEKENEALRAEQAKREKQAAKELKEREEAEKQRFEKERIEEELKEKQEAEAWRLQQIEAEKQTELSKGDNDKVKDLISDLEALTTKYTFKSKTSQKMYSEVGILINKIIKHIEL